MPEHPVLVGIGQAQYVAFVKFFINIGHVVMPEHPVLDGLGQA